MKFWEKVCSLGGGVTGGTLGAIVGKSIGIAALGTAVAGTLPIAAGCAVVGLAGGSLVGRYLDAREDNK